MASQAQAAQAAVGQAVPRGGVEGPWGHSPGRSREGNARRFPGPQSLSRPWSGRECARSAIEARAAAVARARAGRKPGGRARVGRERNPIEEELSVRIKEAMTRDIRIANPSQSIREA